MRDNQNIRLYSYSIYTPTGRLIASIPEYLTQRLNFIQKIYPLGRHIPSHDMLECIPPSPGGNLSNGSSNVMCFGGVCYPKTNYIKKMYKTN